MADIKNKTFEAPRQPPATPTSRPTTKPLAAAPARPKPSKGQSPTAPLAADQVDTRAAMGTANRQSLTLQAVVAKGGATKSGFAGAKGTEADVPEALMDAARDADEVTDINQVLSEANKQGVPREPLLRAMYQNLGGHRADERRAQFTLLSKEFRNLGLIEMAELSLKVSDPAIGNKVQEFIQYAVTGEEDALTALDVAARETRTPAELEVLLLATEETGVATRDEMLKNVLKAMDRRPHDELDPPLFQAIAQEYDSLGEPDRAEALRYLTHPELSRDVRIQLVEALMDDAHTAEELENALVLARSDLDIDVTMVTADATVGPEHAAQLLAMNKVRAAQGVYDKVVEGLTEVNAALQLGLDKLEGRPKEEQEDFVTAFMKLHEADYKKLADARAAMADVLAEHETAITAALVSSEPLGEIEPAELEAALQVAVEDKDGHGVAMRMATAVTQKADQVPEERLEWLMDEVVPHVFQTEVERRLNAGDDALQAIEGFKNSALYRAMEALKPGLEVTKRTEKFTQGVEDLSKAIRDTSADGVARVIEASAGGADDGSRLDIGLAAVGLVLGGMTVSNPDGLGTRIRDTLDAAGHGADVLGIVGKLVGGANHPLVKFGKVGAVLGVVQSAFSGVMNLGEGNMAGAAADGAMATLGVLGLMHVPGANLAAAFVMAGMFIGDQIDQAQKEDRRRDRVDEAFQVMVDKKQLDPALAAFLSSNKPGAYASVKENLGLTDAQVMTLLKPGSPWSTGLAELSRQPDMIRRMKNKAPDGNLMKVFERLGEDMGPGEGRRVVDMMALAFSTMEDPMTGRRLTLHERFNTGGPGRDQAVSNVIEVLNPT